MGELRKQIIPDLTNENRLIKTLVLVTVILVGLNIISELLGNPSWQIERLIKLDYEVNLPTWFSSMVLAIAAYFAYKCSLAVKTIKAGKRMWQLLSLGLLGMSCDETAQIHEKLGNIINKYFFHQKRFSSAWVVFLGPFILTAMFIFAFKMKRYLKGSRRAVKYLLLGFFLYIAGAFLLDMTINFLSSENVKRFYLIESISEETCEMFGTILFIKGLIIHYKLFNEQF